MNESIEFGILTSGFKFNSPLITHLLQKNFFICKMEKLMLLLKVVWTTRQGAKCVKLVSTTCRHATLKPPSAGLECNEVPPSKKHRL